MTHQLNLLGTGSLQQWDGLELELIEDQGEL